MNDYDFTLCFLAAAMAFFSQLSAAPAPYETAQQLLNSGQSSMNSAMTQGQQYGNYAMNEASTNGQYAMDSLQSNGQYAMDTMQSNGQYAVNKMQSTGQQAVDAGQNMMNKAQTSIGNISLNPLSYMPYWMQPNPQNLANLAQTTSNYVNHYAQKSNELLHSVGEQTKDMMKSAQENGQYYMQKGMENGQYLIGKAKEKGQELSHNIAAMANSGFGQGKDFTKGGIQQGAESVKTMGGYEKSYLGSLGDKLDSFNGYIAEKLYKTADGVGNLSIPNLEQQM